MQPTLGAEHELKLAVPDAAIAALRGFLRGACRPESPYAEGWVDSIYFDTSGLELYGEKAASDLVKTKVRLRWYDVGEAVFGEVKRRYGTRRAKVRIASPLRAAELAGRGMAVPALRDLPAALVSSGAAVPHGLAPIMRIRYRRERWIAPDGTRVSLDSAIRAPEWAPRLGGARPGIGLAGAVLELKGSRPRLPDALAGVALLGCRRRAVSKYGLLMDRVLGVERDDA